jgi:hypothetical protein
MNDTKTTVIEYAIYLVQRMLDSLNNGEWYGYEFKALNMLEKWTKRKKMIFI